jgi:hypothetical protein
MLQFRLVNLRQLPVFDLLPAGYPDVTYLVGPRCVQYIDNSPAIDGDRMLRHDQIVWRDRNTPFGQYQGVAVVHL